MSISTSKIVLSALSRNSEFSGKVFPHLKTEYFGHSDRVLYKIITKFISKYSSLPSKEAILIELEKTEDVNRTMYNDCIDTVGELFDYELKDKEWLVDTAERFCKDMALNIAIIEAADIVGKISSGNGEGLSESSIPDLLTKAVSVCFNDDVGQDYIDGADERYDRYNIVDDKVQFELDIFNKVTNGGFSKKRLHIFIGGVGGGKTLSKCSMAASNLTMGRNVLYITLEIDKDELAKRIDANLMDIDINNIQSIGKSTYVNNINSLKKKTVGKLVIYEDMSGQFSSIKLKYILDELKLKKGFLPDVVYVDYLGLCVSSTFKAGTTTSYIFYKAVSEELRNVANQYNFALVTSMQLNRSNFDNSDAGLTGIADSFGVAHTADWIGIIIGSDELRAVNQMEISQVKSRYTNLVENRRFLVGVDMTRMKLYDLENSSSGNFTTRNTSNTSAVNEGAILTGIKSKFGLDTLTF
jgi:KaiC/GvpD/RAD55 family RecA-like ATPase